MDLVYDAQEIWECLASRGFSDEEVEEALEHIERISLEAPGPYWSEDYPTYRSYAPEETVRVSSKARGYLWRLKSKGVIDHALEDEIVQKVMNLDSRAGVREIKTVAALTIFGYEHRLQSESEGISGRLLS